MRLNINSARKGNSSYTFTPMSVVSLDFGRLQPVRRFTVIPGGDDFDVSSKGLLRCTPQVFPPFGRMNCKSASFFVPDSQIFSWSTAFHADSKQWRGQASDFVPSINSYSINRFFVNSGILGLISIVSLNPSAVPPRNSFDLTFPSPDSTRSVGKTNLDFYKLTPLGWKIFSILKGVGFDFITFPTDTTNSLTFSQHRDRSSSRISFVPFLCYCKVWNDFFCNSYHSDQNPVSSFLQSIYLNKTHTSVGITWYDSSTGIINDDCFSYLFSLITVPFESNMYTNAWNNPNDPTGLEIARINQVSSQSLISPFGSTDFGEFGSLVADSNRNRHRDLGGSTSRFSQLGHRTLEAFDRFVRRRNLVGSKAVQQIYALFGALPGEWTKDYVVKLSESSSRVNFSAITSSSDTVNGSNGKALGDFAGTGLAGVEFDFSYKSDTYGTIICLSWLNIDPILMRGLDPDVLRIKPLDFYNPDFDGKAYRPIPYSEITGGKVIDGDSFDSTLIYGYTNMYDDYRQMRDLVCGTFLDDTTKNFAFMRDLTETRNNMALSSLIMHPQTSDVQYWKIDGDSDLTNPFLTLASAGDRFWLCIDWTINATRPILSSENSFDLEGEGNLQIVKNGDGMA